MAEQVYISTGRVKELAGDLANVNTKLTDKLNEIRKVMTNIGNDSTYSSPAADECAERFTSMADKRIPQFNEIVNSYVKFLQETAELHEKLDITNQNQLENTVEPFN